MSENSQVMASLAGVSKQYGQGHTAFWALRGVNLEVRCGEFTVLMGPSGSGKTTLLSIIGCLLSPTEGNVEICGERADLLDERSLPRVRREKIGFVFQGFNLLGSLSALENVEVPFLLCGGKQAIARGRAQELLDAVGLRGKEKQLPEDLSGGEKQRVAIARALATEPRIVLADEPTAALDTRTGLQIMGLLRERAHRGVAVMVVTHDVRLETLADRVVRLEDGRIVP